MPKTLFQKAPGVSRRASLVLGLLAVLAACSPAEKAPAPPVTVFAAASLTDALTAIAAEHEQQTGQVVRLSFAASGAVARQIDAGAPADLVILADREWMDRLQASGRIQPGTRRDLLGNRLVVIGGPEDAAEGDPLATLKGAGGRLAIGDPESVPAGTYARTWLRQTGQWDGLQPFIVTAADVRAVRTFVARGEARFGVVYRSDATGYDGVRILFEPPAAVQPDIVYPAALAAGSVNGEAFLARLRTPEAGAVFRRYGFDPLG